MTTIMKISSRNLVSVRRRSLVKGGMAAILASGLAPGFARAEAKKLVMAHLNAVPESAAVAFDWQAGEVRKRSGGELDLTRVTASEQLQPRRVELAMKTGDELDRWWGENLAVSRREQLEGCRAHNPWTGLPASARPK